MEQNHTHSHTAPAHAPSLNRLAFTATTHCLTGCAIGEVLGMVIGTAANWHNAATVTVSTILAFIFGYAFTLVPLLKNGVEFRTALGLALASDTLSIAIMEIVDNAVILLIPGALDAGLSDVLFWSTLALSLLLAFVAAFPVNRWLIQLGRGHARLHTHLHH